MVDTYPLTRFLRVEQGWEAGLLFDLKRSYADAARDIKRLEAIQGIGASIRGDQLRLAQRALLEEQARLWTAVSSSVQAGRASAAAAAAGVTHHYSDMLLRSALSPIQRDAMLRAAQATARRNVENVTSRVMGYSRMPLSEQVYKTRAWSNGLIDRRINSVIARGGSARDLAAEVRDLIRPDTPGGVKYAAQRLGRTELNNAFHATSVRGYQKAPWVTGVKWELSGSHPVADECDDYAESSHYDGGDPGVFRPADVPEKPHPNCLCFTSPVTVKDEEFLDQYFSGAYDEYIDGVLREAGYPMPNSGSVLNMVRSATPAPRSTGNPIDVQVIAQARKDAKLSRKTVADEAKISRARLDRIERDGGTADEIQNLMAALERLGAKLPSGKIDDIIDETVAVIHEVNGAYLRTRREAGGFSRNEVARESGLTPAQIGRIELKGGTAQEMKAISEALDRMGVPGYVPVTPDTIVPKPVIKKVKEPKRPRDLTRDDIELHGTDRTKFLEWSEKRTQVVEIWHPTYGHIGDVYKWEDIAHVTGGRSYSYGTQVMKGWRTEFSPNALKLINEERRLAGLSPLDLAATRSSVLARTQGRAIEDLARNVEQRLANMTAKIANPDAVLTPNGQIISFSKTGRATTPDGGRWTLARQLNGEYRWVTSGSASPVDDALNDALNAAIKKWGEQQRALETKRIAHRAAQRDPAPAQSKVIMKDADDLRADISNRGFGDALYDRDYVSQAAQADLQRIQDIGERAALEIRRRTDELVAARRAEMGGSYPTTPYAQATIEREIRVQVTRDFIREARGVAMEGDVPTVTSYVGPAKKGYHQTIRQPTKRVTDAMDTTMRTYPDEWVQAFDQRFGGNLQVYQGSRGYFNGREINISFNGTFDDLIETTFHEVGHGMEEAVSGLRRAQQAWWEKRAGGAYTHAKDNGFFPVNPAYPTPRPYTLKRYDSRTAYVDQMGYEIFTTGVQELLGSGASIYADRDLSTFILGSLLCL